MHALKIVLALIPILAVACDVEDETATRIGDGYVGAGLQFDGEQAVDEFADAVEPVLAGYCDNVTTWPAAWKAFEVEVITLINKRRASGATCGGVWRKPVPALVKHNKLRCAARKHSRDMAANDFTSHTGSNGSSPWDRIKAAGYNYASAENIAWGYHTPAAVVDGWMKSTAHCNNIMSAGVNEVGVGYYYDASNSWKHLWTQDFGKQP